MLVQRALLRTAQRTIPRCHTSTVFRRNALQFRPSSTAAAKDEAALLVAQRLRRPISPHVTIYKAQIPWYMSGFNRITGVALSGTLYLYLMAYIFFPRALASDKIAAKFAAMGAVSMGIIKGIASYPFTYHCWNGLRHMSWDTGRLLTNTGVKQTGLVVLGLSAASSVVLAVL